MAGEFLEYGVGPRPLSPINHSSYFESRQRDSLQKILLLINDNNPHQLLYDNFFFSKAPTMVWIAHHWNLRPYQLRITNCAFSPLFLGLYFGYDLIIVIFLALIHLHFLLSDKKSSTTSTKKWVTFGVMNRCKTIFQILFPETKISRF